MEPCGKWRSDMMELFICSSLSLYFLATWQRNGVGPGFPCQVSISIGLRTIRLRRNRLAQLISVGFSIGLSIGLSTVD